jgi:membrane fusion protein, multidrug efflux system
LTQEAEISTQLIGSAKSPAHSTLERKAMSDSPTDREIMPRGNDRSSPDEGIHPEQAEQFQKKPDRELGRDDVDKANANEEKRKKRRPLVVTIGIIVVGLLAIFGIYYWLSTRQMESTDDAYTDGRAISIAPQVAGIVISLDVTDNQFVRRGQKLIRIDPRQYEADREQAEGALATAKSQFAGQQFGAEIARKNFPAQLEQSQALLANAQAHFIKAQADYNRQRGLTTQATTQQDVDAAIAALKQAQAQVMLAEAQVTQNSPVPQKIGEADAQVGRLQGLVGQAQAKLDQANLNLSWTVVTAPQDGWITKRNVEEGVYVAPGQQIFSIVAPEVWITANFKESQIADMRKGQLVKIKVDAYPTLDLRGHVDSIQMGSGSKFTAFPPENAAGNFVKVVQRVPVKIVIDSGLDPEIPLPLGISVQPTVSVR